MDETNALLRVLVIDDDPIYLHLVETFLSRLPCEVKLIQNNLDVLPYVRDNPVDLCFMDLVMPEMGGVALTRMIRHDLGKTFPIVAVSAYYLTPAGEECREAGMDGFLQKPVCFADVQNVVSIHMKCKG